MFFNVVEGGSMTFDRLVKVCKMSLGKFSSDTLKQFRDEMAHHFARFIFEAFNVDLDKEVNMDKIKTEVLNPNSPH